MAFAQTLKTITTTAVITSLAWMVIVGVLLQRGTLAVPEGSSTSVSSGSDPAGAATSGNPEAAPSPLPPATMAAASLVPARYDPADGRMVIPVRGVSAAQLVDTFNDARSEGRVHNAIDIMAPTGTPVFAAAPGAIAKLFVSRLGGNTIYIRSFDQRRIYYYAHLSAYAPGLAEKQRVQAGQVIGAVGYSGDANPASPHLHFAINEVDPAEGWWKGVAINPYPLLRGR